MQMNVRVTKPLIKQPCSIFLRVAVTVKMPARFVTCSVHSIATCGISAAYNGEHRNNTLF